MNGARTTLEVRLVHCIGSVLDLEAVYTLMRSTGPGLVVDGAVVNGRTYVLSMHDCPPNAQGGGTQAMGMEAASMEDGTSCTGTEGTGCSLSESRGLDMAWRWL